MKARDWIAMIVIVSATFLIWSGANGTIGAMLLMVVSYYFGGELLYGPGSKTSSLYKDIKIRGKV